MRYSHGRRALPGSSKDSPIPKVAAHMSFPVLKALRLSATLFVASGIAAAQQVPTPEGAPRFACQPAAAPNFAGLRVFNGTAPVPRVYFCGSNGNPAGTCFTQYLDPLKPEEYQGDLIAAGPVQGAWTCAMVGGWPGWVPTDRLSSVPATPAVTTQQWLGTWVNGLIGTHGDRMVLSRSAAGHGILHAEAKATYTNIAHNTASGEVSGDALAMGPFLHILDTGDQPGCALDLKYDVTNGTIRAVDNQICGGHNVSFDGVWHRVSSGK